MRKAIKKYKIIILVFLVIFLIFLGIVYILNDKKVAVLGYHGILPHNKNLELNEMIIDQEKFESQLKILSKLGYNSMTLDEYYCWKMGTCSKKHKSVLITFDDGYYNNYEYAFDLLKKYNMNAVVFIVGKYTFLNNEENNYFLDKKTLNEIAQKYPNIEIASHSYNLHNRDNKFFEEINEDINQMKNVGGNYKYYAYPFGIINDDYIRALKDNGYKMAFGFGPDYRKSDKNDNIFNIPRLSINASIPDWKFILRIILPI